MNHFLFLLTSLALLISCQSTTTPENKDQSSSITTSISTDTIINKTEEPVELNEKEVKLVNNEIVAPPKPATASPALKKSQKELNTSAAQEEEKVKKAKAEAIEEEKEVAEKEKPEVAVEKTPDHSTWNTLLKKYVSSTGDVNYAGVLAEKATLQTYLDELSANPPKDTWRSNEKLAYWINAYNAFTVKLIIDNYPVASITDLHNGKPWDVKWIMIGDKKYSLNNIENDIIRPKFGDARIHFAVNCAAKSCPPLLNEAYQAAQLNSQLEQRSKKFINNVSYNQILSDKVTISKIFDWYRSDFGPSLVDYLNRYADTTIQEEASVNFKEYDWSLNK